MGKVNYYNYIVKILLILFLAFSFSGCGFLAEDEINGTINLEEKTSVNGMIIVQDYAWSHPDFGDLEIEWAPSQGAIGSDYLKNFYDSNTSISDPDFSDPNFYINVSIPYSYNFNLSLSNGTYTITPDLDGYVFSPSSRDITVPGTTSFQFTVSRAKWEFSLDANSEQNFTNFPAIDIANNRIYIGCDDGILYALNTSGSEIWANGKQITSNFSSLTSSPMIDANGTIYIGSEDGSLYALDSSGNSISNVSDASADVPWPNQSSTSPIYSTPVIDSDGSIYFADNDGVLYCIDPNGNERFSYDTEGKISSTCAIGSNEYVYIGNEDGDFYAIDSVADPNGDYKWEEYLSDKISSTCAIGSDGKIYISSNSNFYICDPNGEPDKCTPIAFAGSESVSSMSSPVIGSDGKIYIGAVEDSSDPEKCYLYLYDPDPNSTGELSKLSTLNGSEVSSPTVGSDDTIYITTHYTDSNNTAINSLYAIDPNGDLLWDPPFITKVKNAPNLLPGEILCSPVMGSDGTIYMADSSKLYAVTTQSERVSSSNWPMFAKNASHTSSMPDNRGPADVSNIKVYAYAPNSLNINWENPETYDFMGAILIADPNGYSSNKNNKTDLVDNSHNITSIDPNNPYFYTIFTYDNETSPNYSNGKNVPSLYISKFKAEIIDSNQNTVQLSWKVLDPNNYIGITIMRDPNKYPEDTSDGDWVNQSDSNNPIRDPNLGSRTYFYSAFSNDPNFANVINRDSVNLSE